MARPWQISDKTILGSWTLIRMIPRAALMIESMRAFGGENIALY